VIGSAVSFKVVPTATLPEHLEPQATTAGDPVIVPSPRLVTVTIGWKAAATVETSLSTVVHASAALGEQGPRQPPKA
jgi:hypothetical protein